MKKKKFNPQYINYWRQLINQNIDIDKDIPELAQQLSMQRQVLKSFWRLFYKVGFFDVGLMTEYLSDSDISNPSKYFYNLYFRETKNTLPLVFAKKTILQNFYQFFNKPQSNLFLNLTNQKIWSTPLNLLKSEGSGNFLNLSLVNQNVGFNQQHTFNNFDAIEVNRWLKSTDEVKLPVRLLKTPLKYTNFNDLSTSLDENFKLFRFRFNDDTDLLQHKPLPHSTYLVYKQKRYQRRDKFVHKHGFNYETSILKNPLLNSTVDQKVFLNTNPQVDEVGLTAWLVAYNKIFQQIRNLTTTKAEFNLLLTLRDKVLDNPSPSVDFEEPLQNLKQHSFTSKDPKHINPYLVGNQLIVDNLETVLPNYRALKKNKTMSETTSNVLNRRLLRTKRTLVLPAHVNITIITNSYDVIHSWFIPGLGLKLDCIPGRATHHMLHIDNVGFYYGQCAEICGRYHHHMPIRICALPFEHFLVWWHTFGLPKMLNINSKTKLNSTYSSKKYSW